MYHKKGYFLKVLIESNIKYGKNANASEGDVIKSIEISR